VGYYAQAKELICRINDVNADLLLLTYLHCISLISSSLISVVEDDNYFLTSVFMLYIAMYGVIFRSAAEGHHKVILNFNPLH
jgi:ABC-type polysaccharide/polyol phosphate export permease